MKKLLLLVLSIGLSQLSYADYLDDWPDNALCGWMENPSTPSYMVEEVKTRGIICSGGNVINIPPELPLPPPEEGPELLLPLLIPGWKLGDPIPPEWIVYWEEHQSIRPGWKILEGTDLWVIDETNPYWQTEEGLNEKPPKIDPGIEYPPETLPGADPKKVPDLPPEVDKPPTDPNPPPKLADPTDPNPPPKIDPGIEYPPETLPGADPKKVPDLPPEVDKPPTDPNPPPKLADPTVLQPIDPS